MSSTQNKKAAGLRVASRLSGVISADFLKTDALYTYAYSGDASYFRLVPALVVIVNSEDEVRAVLAAARAEGLSVTFRAAGTSLSGQAVTDAVLCVLGDGWRKIEVKDQGEKVTLGPATIVGQANSALKPLDRKIGPDPASQATCKIGGVVANNSSGMCCGVVQNTYHTMDRLRLILGDGTLLDSGDLLSREHLRAKRPDLVAGLAALAGEVARDNELVDLITRKYRIKNTVGYSLNALVDFTDPIDILTHLMVGSEGTLGFVSEVTYNTVPDHPHKATALVPFATNNKAAEGVEALHHVGVSAAEFIERRALATVEDKAAMQPFLSILTPTSPAVLIELMAESEKALDAEIAKATRALMEVGALSMPRFTKDDALQQGLWDVRKGLFASAGASRPAGTVMLTEDVAVPIHRLADAVDDLRRVLDEHGYDDGIIFGHALAGNLHFQMSADFTAPAEVARFEGFSAALADLVSLRYEGSLKAEHGTGRAIAAFVEQEWGKKAYKVMGRIKALFDPEGLLNPGVLMSDDPQVHLKNLKNMGLADETADLCIECGFCETVCPSAGLTLTPRQRIAVTREQARLKGSGEDPTMLDTLTEDFVHAGLETCAACNLCSTKCPVGIETGTMIMHQRAGRRGNGEQLLASLAAGAMGAVELGLGGALRMQNASRALVGGGTVDAIGATLNRASGHRLPMPSAAQRPGPGTPKRGRSDPAAPRGRLVYFPACASRMFGAAKTGHDLLPVTEAMLALLRRVGFDPVMPEGLTGACCGQPFLSKGFPEEAKRVGKQLHRSIGAAQAGKDCSIVTDMSTCSLHLKADGVTALDSAEFLFAEVLPHLTITRRWPVVAVHHNCSAQRQNEQKMTEALASAAATQIAVLKSVSCCGYAGDKGMFEPELNKHALRFAHRDIPPECTIGVSTVATCATGLSDHLGVPFVSLASLLEYASRPER